MTTKLRWEFVDVDYSEYQIFPKPSTEYFINNRKLRHHISMFA